MIGISRQTDYAARLVLHLACLEPGTRVPIAEISKSRLLPAPYTRRIVGCLVKHGILASARGTGGGISLARPSSAISLLDILNAVEGGVTLNTCTEGGVPCVFGPGCIVKQAWSRVTASLQRELAAVTFDTLTGAEPGHQAAHAQRAADARPKRPRATPA